ncbi:hypothetical protein Tco_1415023 [Tanacetum coccineum]|uniref:Uncharacterized protein n=1 Tax=Tanacetum coccineum TaxID=301880 RepID=A0ABQ4Z3I4_9ASTR
MNLSKCSNWFDVIDSFTKCLSSWKSKCLSIGGRLTLTKTVLGSLPLYYFSIFRAPIKVFNKLESIRSRFFWGIKDGVKGISWVKWNKVCANINVGGLGIGSIRVGLLGKWKWRFLNEPNALWCRVIKVLHGDNGGFGVSSKRVDPWHKSGCIMKDKFPRLYALELEILCLFKDRWIHTSGIWSCNWNWRSAPRGRTLDEVSTLMSLIRDMSLDPNAPDRWQWGLHNSRKFSVRALSALIQNSLNGPLSRGINFRWNN